MVGGRLPSLDIDNINNIDIDIYLDTHPAPAPRLAAHRAVLGVVRHREARAGLVLGAETCTQPSVLATPGPVCSVPLLEWCDMLWGRV